MSRGQQFAALQGQHYLHYQGLILEAPLEEPTPPRFQPSPPVGGTYYIPPQMPGGMATSSFPVRSRWDLS